MLMKLAPPPTHADVHPRNLWRRDDFALSHARRRCRFRAAVGTPPSSWPQHRSWPTSGYGAAWRWASSRTRRCRWVSYRGGGAGKALLVHMHVQLANERIWGNLAVGVIAHPQVQVG